MRTLTMFLSLMLIVAEYSPCAAQAAESEYRPLFYPTPKTHQVKQASLQKAAAVIQNQHIHYPKLTDVVRQTLALHFGASQDGKTTERKFSSITEFANSLPVAPCYEKPAAVFVTLSRQGKTRACWGSVHPLDVDVVKATVFMTEAALKKEYRYPRIKANEWKLLKPQVTIVRSIESMADMSEQNPLKYGLLVRSGGKGAVYLPGEALDAHYQLVQCKLKAGIPVSQPCQLYRIKADVIL